MTDLKLAIEGTIVMSGVLRSLMDAMYDARVPEIWEKMSWQSTTLGFWYTELLERDSQFRRWCFMGRPKVNKTNIKHSLTSFISTFCLFIWYLGNPPICKPNQ